MKTVGLFLLFLLCTLVELVCRTLLLVCGCMEKCTSDCMEKLEKAKRSLCAEYLLTKRRKAKPVLSPGKVVLPAENSVVGQSKTEFIKELPVLKSRQEIKPFKSEPLRMVPQRDDDDDEEDNPGAYDIDTAPDIGELDDFEPDGGEGWTDESSSGVSFEELSETADVLAAEEPSDEERQKAAAVLDAVDGTELFNFIAINEVYAEKARALMSAFREQNGNARQEAFDIGKYME